MIIDCHCHAGHGDGFTGPWDTAAPLRDYLRRASHARIDRTVLFAAFHSDYAIANREVAAIVARHPDRFYGFAFVHAERDRGRICELVGTAVRRYRFCGIKLHRYDARFSGEVGLAAREFGLPMLYDVMGEVSAIELIASEFPDVPLIIPHLGSFSDDWRAQSAIAGFLGEYPNVYADTSGVRRFDLLVKAIRKAGPHKILFGSDGPWLHPGLELAKVRALGLSVADEALVTSGNFLRIIRDIPHRARRTGGDCEPMIGGGYVEPVRSSGLNTTLRDPWTNLEVPAL
jgi:predicted TIM-barrel fold metal-dependent hydrolase